MPRARSTISMLLAAAVASGVLAMPAAAGGSISLSLTPQTRDQARLVQTGLALYAIASNVKGGASVRQKGKRNSAGLVQQGRGNLGIVHQEGKGHDGTLEQSGHGNAYGLFQFGRKTEAAVTQRGDGNSGLTVQWGW